MPMIEAVLFDGKTSASIPCQIECTDDGELRCYNVEHMLIKSIAFDSLLVSSRLGQSPRYLTFPDGSKLETLSNEAIDNLCRKHQHGHGLRWIHYLETRWQYLLLALVVVVLSAGLFFTYGIPWLAKPIANMLPESVSELASAHTLSALDNSMMAESQLTAERQQALQLKMRMLLEDRPELSLRVLFRNSDVIGANAFALPDGTIVMTDQFVELSKDDDEILAVLAHEIGHVYFNHGLQMLVQNSVMTFLLVIVVGDTSATADIVLALPAFLTQMAYSRDLEREADDYSLKMLRRYNIPPAAFVTIMERLSQSAENNNSEGVKEKRKPWLDFMSSHPPTAERIEKFH